MFKLPSSGGRPRARPAEAKSSNLVLRRGHFVREQFLIGCPVDAVLLGPACLLNDPEIGTW